MAGRPIAEHSGSRLTESIFTLIYRLRLWGHRGSVSGPGSSLGATEALRAELPVLLRELGIRRLLDAPCGDCHWIREVDLPVEQYTGCDIVQPLITDHRRHLAGPGREFFSANIITDTLPTADLILCRDCFIHLPIRDIVATLRNFRDSRSTWLLTTNYRRVRRNRPLVTGLWRRINLQAPPFCFPEPVRCIEEPTPAGRDAGKHLALWRLADLPLSRPD